MARPRRLPSFLAVLAFTLQGLGAAPIAEAGDAVVVPLVARSVDPVVLYNLNGLIAAEVDFMGRFGQVEQLELLPLGMDAGCLGSSGCLARAARAQGTDAVIAGELMGRGQALDFAMVYFDRGIIVRKKNFTLPNKPSAIADGIGVYLKELVTGVPAGAEAEVESMGDFETFSVQDLLDEADDLGFEPAAPSPRRRRSARSPGPPRETGLDDITFEPVPDEITVEPVSGGS